MKTYRAAVIGCSRMGGFIDNEVVGARKHVPPYSHGAGFFACDRTDLVACADPRTDVMEKFGERYNVPKERQYTDYREMIARENLDIVSIATQPEPRAEIIIHAANHGIKAIYAEKALCASMSEAQAIVEALQRNGTILNMGTNRRWSVLYDRMKAELDSGELGALKQLVIYMTGTLFNTGSHIFDLLMRLNGDMPVEWVQGTLPKGGDSLDGDLLGADPVGEGTIRFANGVTAYALNTGRGLEVEAICEQGVISALNDGQEFLLRKRVVVDDRGRTALEIVPFPDVKPASSTMALIEDLVHALDTGEAPRGGNAGQIAYANTEIIFAFIESHRRGGARVSLPIESSVRLARNTQPHQPRYTA